MPSMTFHNIGEHGTRRIKSGGDHNRRPPGFNASPSLPYSVPSFLSLTMSMSYSIPPANLLSGSFP